MFLRSLRQSIFAAIRPNAGSVVVSTALSMVPLVMITSAAIDFSRGLNIRTALQAAADAGALASATAIATGKDEVDKRQVAEDAFYANIPADVKSALTGKPSTVIDFGNRTVTLTATANANILVTKFLGNTMGIGATATAVVDPGAPICMMALNPTKTGALSIQGTADLSADKCAVHVNSSDPQALYENGTATGVAESFCVYGGYYGSKYTPKPRSGCMIESDPLAARFKTDWATLNTTTCTSGKVSINTSSSTVTTLVPGVYCGGVEVKKGIVELKPGQYVIRDGEFYVQAQGTVRGTGVTLLMAGNSSTRIVTQAGASLIVSAPTAGVMKGIVIAAHPDLVPDKENLIIGGGSMVLDGIIYLPKQPLKVTGNGDIGLDAKQFAIIADTIDIEGNGQLNIRISNDYKDAGLPPLPEAHEGIRLVN
jgi:Flp pilus assembly protein TadG